jgi:PAP2 superfamily
MTSISWAVSPVDAGMSFLPFGVDGFLWARWLIILAGTLILLRFLLPRSQTTLVQFGRELLILVPAYFAYFVVRGLTEGRVLDAFHHAARVIELERGIGIFWERQLQEQILSFDLLVDLMNWIYIWGHWPVIVLAAVWLFLMHRESYGVYRNAFLISGAIGLVVFATFPVAPPRLLEAWGFVDTVADRSQAYRAFQNPAFVNQFAAMPSLHFGWNLLVGIAIVRHSIGPIPKLFGVLMPTAMLASIVFTANHYIIDGAAGGGLALIGLAIALLLSKLFESSDGQRDGDAIPSASGPPLAPA